VKLKNQKSKKLKKLIMPCRVGITTDLNRREKEWRIQYPNLRNFRKIQTFLSKEKAQKFENDYAESHGCEASPGGNDANGLWYVYHFEY
jgi:hypothetical protein